MRVAMVLLVALLCGLAVAEQMSLRGMSGEAGAGAPVEIPSSADVKKCAFCKYWDNLVEWCKKNKQESASCKFADKCKELNKDKKRTPGGLCVAGDPTSRQAPPNNPDPNKPDPPAPSGGGGCSGHSWTDKDADKDKKKAACCSDPKCGFASKKSPHTCMTKERAKGLALPDSDNVCGGGGEDPKKSDDKKPPAAAAATTTTTTTKKPDDGKGGGTCKGRDGATKGTPIWCKCNAKPKLQVIGNEPDCTNPGGGRKDVCVWDAAKKVCVPGKPAVPAAQKKEAAAATTTTTTTKPAGATTTTTTAKPKAAGNAKCIGRKGAKSGKDLTVIAPERAGNKNKVCCEPPGFAGGGLKRYWKHECRTGEKEVPRNKCCSN